MHSKKFHVIITSTIICLILLTVSSILFAEDVRYSDRGDRFEGVKTEKNVSGGYFKLLGITIEDGSQIDLSSSQLNLSFCLPSLDTINIRVLHPDTNYVMVPKKKDYVKGNNTFSWPTEPVVKRLKALDLKQVQILVRNSTETLYFPARLSTQESSQKPVNKYHLNSAIEFNENLKNPGFRYQFTFESNGSINFDVSILREDNDKRVIVRQLKLVTRSPGIVPINWDGKDDSGNKVSSGTFILRLEGSLRLKTSIAPREEEVPFYACIEN